jgi:hypothetical protein
MKDSYGLDEKLKNVETEKDGFHMKKTNHRKDYKSLYELLGVPRGLSHDETVRLFREKITLKTIKDLKKLLRGTPEEVYEKNKKSFEKTKIRSEMSEVIRLLIQDPDAYELLRPIPDPGKAYSTNFSLGLAEDISMPTNLQSYKSNYRA